MSGKPRKAFDGIARPQGFIDDAAKAALKGIKIAVGTATRARPRAVKDLEKRGISKVDAKDFIYGNKGKYKPKPPTRGDMYTKALAAEKRLKSGEFRKTYREYDLEGINKARAEDRADVAAFMAKKKRGRR
mgnify:CR=1 FL=1|tara:strand:+ start:462 stop:854 length:393 start_codon:yes stop_codon:yes gene_type:complete